MNTPQRLVIVGNGMAGGKLTEEILARERARYAITVLGDEPIAVFHGRDGRWIVAHGVCPHKSGPIMDSIYGNGRLVCPLHSYSFDTTTGVCDNPDIAPLRIYEAAVRDDRVRIRLTPAKEKV